MEDFESFDPRFERFVMGNAPVEKIAEGFRWTEGPVWFGDAGCLLFSDIPNDRILRWIEGAGVSVFRQPSNYANGHTRDRQGRLVSCEHGARRVTRTEPDGRVGADPWLQALPWLALLAFLFLFHRFTRQGRRVDTYEAIWGPKPAACPKARNGPDGR